MLELRGSSPNPVPCRPSSSAILSDPPGTTTIICSSRDASGTCWSRLPRRPEQRAAILRKSLLPSRQKSHYQGFDLPQCQRAFAESSVTIALRSPQEVFDTGLPMWPAEKPTPSPPVWYGTTFLQSGFKEQSAQVGAIFMRFPGT